MPDELKLKIVGEQVGDQVGEQDGKQDGEQDLAECLALRRQVFIDEQGVPESLEIDGLDPEATAWVARLGPRVVGTARARIVAGSAKAERVAVRADLRGSGIGRALMGAIENWARDLGLRRIALNAQESAIPFYLALGYAVTGEPFDDAGIPHRAMEKPLLPAGE